MQADIGELCILEDAEISRRVNLATTALAQPARQQSVVTMAETHFVSTTAFSLALAFAVMMIALLMHQISRVQMNQCKHITYLGHSPETELEHTSANKEIDIAVGASQHGDRG